MMPKTPEERVDDLVAATTDAEALLAAADLMIDLRHELEALRLALSRAASELMRRSVAH